MIARIDRLVGDRAERSQTVSPGLHRDRRGGNKDTSSAISPGPTRMRLSMRPIRRCWAAAGWMARFTGRAARNCSNSAKRSLATRGIRCPTGEARITPAGKLKCRYVIHTVGPRYHEDRNPAALLHAVYANSLRLAQQYACASVAFPAISCGVYGYPPHGTKAVSRHRSNPTGASRVAVGDGLPNRGPDR